MKIDQDQLEMLADIAVEADCSFRSHYSGRGMYGASCPGVVVGSLRDAFRFMADVRDRDEGLFDDLLDGLSMDSMGFSTIVYFSSVSTESLQQVGGDDDGF